MISLIWKFALLATFITFVGINYIFSFKGSIIEEYKPKISAEKDSTKQKAFIVLEAKCNVCHLKKKPELFFTLANMNTYAFSINDEVFIRKKMPKGRKFPLTNEDEKALKLWLKSQQVPD